MMMATTMAVLLGNGVSMGVAETQDQKKHKMAMAQGHGCCRLNTRPKHTHKNKKYLKRNSVKKKSHCNFFFVLGDEKTKHTQKMAMTRA
jgi:hypothetical protein